MAVYVGIDVHKKYCHAALMDEAGRIQCELRFDNTLEGASGLVNLARSIDPHVKAVVERQQTTGSKSTTGGTRPQLGADIRSSLPCQNSPVLRA
jgi:hypothetical protein